jgi:pyrroloquinoline quinone (PQQ) biosynthesis protein C
MAGSTATITSRNTGAAVRDRMLPRIDAIAKKYRAEDPWTAYSGTALTKQGAAIYCQQHGVFTRHSRRAWAYVVGNCPEVEVRRFIVKENLYEEEGIPEESHFLKLVKMANAVGVSNAEMDGAAALPSTQAALLIWETLTKDRHWLVGAAAKGGLEYKTTSGLEGERWMHRLGLSRGEADFWLLHHEADAVHGMGSLDLVLKYLPAQNVATDDDIAEAVELSLFAYNMFRRGIVEHALSTA